MSELSKSQHSQSGQNQFNYPKDIPLFDVILQTQQDIITEIKYLTKNIDKYLEINKYNKYDHPHQNQ